MGKTAWVLTGCLLLSGCGVSKEPTAGLPSVTEIAPLSVAASPTAVTAHEIANVPILKQGPELPTGCEATSLTMLLQYEGLNVDKTQVVSKLPTVAVPNYEGSDGDEMVGGDPNRGFVGDPFTDEGYGVFHEPIADVLAEYLPGRARDLSGKSFDEVLAALADDHPVVAWMAMDLADVSTAYVWKTEDGEEIQWKVPEHCVLLTGYEEHSVTVHDPYSGQIVHYDRERFRQVWEDMGSQAVTVQSKA
nr:C39 family peptidase [Tumebacillus amylolyticus]